eukprot:SAG31_NODE_117_length_24022_cov_6.878067_22_plen_134_part_00
MCNVQFAVLTTPEFARCDGLPDKLLHNLRMWRGQLLSFVERPELANLDNACLRHLALHARYGRLHKRHAATHGALMQQQRHPRDVRVYHAQKCAHAALAALAVDGDHGRPQHEAAEVDANGTYIEAGRPHGVP